MDFTQQLLVIRDFFDVADGIAATLLVENDVIWGRLQPRNGPVTNVGQLAFDPLLHRWLQIRGDGDRVVFEVAGDDLQFMVIGETAAPFGLVGARPELVAGNWNPIDGLQEVSFEHFAICPEP